MHVTVEVGRPRDLPADPAHNLALSEVMTLSHGDVPLSAFPDADHRG